MAYRAQHNRFTLYDMLENKGYFAGNPANVDSRDEKNMSLYKGPVEFPKMLYSPKGEMRITVPGVPTATPLGPQLLGEQKELISQVVENKEQEAKLLAAGWHKHPADALIAGGATNVAKPAPAPADLAAENARLLAELAALRAQTEAKAPAPPPGKAAPASVIKSSDE